MNKQMELTKREKNKMPHIVLPAEWEPQSGIQLTWPHKETDWAPMLDQISHCYADIVREITRHEPVMIVTPDIKGVLPYMENIEKENVFFYEVANTNDTWARDHGGITVMADGRPVVCDFIFNGWGLKYPADFDNRITAEMARGAFARDVRVRRIPFVLEGGSIESDGRGTLLTTQQCIFSPNRNDCFLMSQVVNSLKKYLGAERILLLEHGHLNGDDTDGHVDTLARFCDTETIAYVQCTDKEDPHRDELKKMELQLRTFRTADGMPYRLIPLPMADAVYNEDGEQLPATYANFLIINGAVLVPAYGNKEKDETARQTLAEVFPDRRAVSLDCRPLIRQRGSLHCAAMQYPAGVLNTALPPKLP